MATEIERKFLVRGEAWKVGADGKLFRQGYLSTEKERTVRVRLAGAHGYITIKGKSTGITRAEFEYEIPAADAGELLDTLCLKPLIEKRRYRINHLNNIWEVDEFMGENTGLVVAEIELADAAQTVELPDWIGAEVSDDPRYFNANLVSHPYSQWDMNQK